MNKNGRNEAHGIVIVSIVEYIIIIMELMVRDVNDAVAYVPYNDWETTAVWSLFSRFVRCQIFGFACLMTKTLSPKQLDLCEMRVYSVASHCRKKSDQRVQEVGTQCSCIIIIIYHSMVKLFERITCSQNRFSDE